MAAKVNTKFVIILAGALLTAFAAVAGAGFYLLKQTGVRHERTGDAALARGDMETATRSYGRAVGKEPSNVAYLKKWRDAMAKWSPATETEYNEYYDHYVRAHIAMAAVEQTNPQTQREMLEILMADMLVRGRGDGWDRLATTADGVVQKLDPSNPETQKIRRYRGLSQLYRMRTLEQPEQVRKLTLEDLEAAQKADAKDVDVALGLIEFKTMDAARERRSGRVEESEQKWRQAVEMAKEAVSRFPGDPRPMLRQWQLNADIAQQTAINEGERRAAVMRLADALDPVIEATKATVKEHGDASFMRNVVFTLLQARPQEGMRSALSLADAALAARPSDSQLMILRAQLLSQLEENKEAIAQLQKVIDAAEIPISLAGKQLREDRSTALQMQIDQNLMMWSKADPKDQAALLAEAKQRRDALVKRVGEKSPLVLRTDGRLAFAEGRNQDAIRLLTELSLMLQNRDPETLSMLATSLVRDGSLGAAVKQYDQILSVDPQNVTALLASAELDLRLEQVDSAKSRLIRVLAIDPKNEQADRTLKLIDAATKQNVTADTDPTLKALLESRKLRTQSEPDLAGAAKLLDAALKERPDDLRLVSDRAGLYAQMTDIDGAKRFIGEKLKQYPDNPMLKAFMLQLEISDPVEARLAIIEQSSASAVEKALQRYLTLRGANRTKDATATLAEAAKAAPDDARVMDLLFVEAMERKDFAAGREMAQKAAAKNLDQVNGLMYQARLEMTEGKNEAALGTLDRITQQMPFNAPAWRLLGQANMSVGKVDDGIAAFRKAMEIRPNDVTMIRPYLAALARVGRGKEALEVARRAVSLAPEDIVLGEALLDLEEQVGDKKAAIRGRRDIFARSPENSANATSLARMLIDTKDFDGASKVIEKMPSDGLGASVKTILTAQVLGARGSFDEAMKLVNDHLATLKTPKDRLEVELALSDMLLAMGREDDAVKALEDARKSQDPKRMEADRKLGDLHFDRGRNEPAAESYKRVVDAGADENETVAKRRTEALLRLKKWEEAEQAVSAIEKRTKRDLQTAMLLAEAAAGREDVKRAMTLLDEAAKIAPTSHLPFLRRAQLNFNDNDQFAAVMKDLEQSLKLRPDLSVARQMRTALLYRRGRDNEAIQEMQNAVATAPDDDDLRVRYIADLLRLKRTDEVRAAVADAVKTRGTANKAWITRAGDISTRLGDLRAAADYYGKAWEADKTLDNLGRLVDTQLRTSPPMTAEAQKALDGAPKSLRDENPSMITVLRARLSSAQNKDADARRLLTEVWSGMRETPAGIRLWFDQADIICKNDPAKTLEFARTLVPDAMKADPITRVMMAMRMARQRDPSVWKEALRLTDGAVEQIKDVPTLVTLHRIRGQIFYIGEDFRLAAEEYERGVKVAPDDAEFTNNLAYTLGKHLGELERATKYAERAALIDPQNANILDTLGWLHLKSNRLVAAEQTLKRALEAASNDEDRLAVRVHLAQTRLAQGIKDEARLHAEEAELLMAKNPLLGPTYRAELDEVNKRLRGAE